MSEQKFTLVQPGKLEQLEIAALWVLRRPVLLLVSLAVIVLSMITIPRTFMIIQGVVLLSWMATLAVTLWFDKITDRINQLREEGDFYEEADPAPEGEAEGGRPAA